MACGDYSLDCKACALKVDKWQRHLDQIFDEVKLISADHLVFHCVVDMMDREKVYELDRTFYTWVGSIYQEAVSLRVRRLLDRRDGTYSIRVLIEDIADNAPVLTRARFRQLYSNTVIPVAAVDGYFDKLNLRGGDVLWARSAQLDLEALERVSQRVRDAADKRFAHYDRTPPKELPTWGEVADCVNELERVVTRYRALIQGAPLEFEPPVLPAGWMDVFSWPWRTPRQKPDGRP